MINIRNAACVSVALVALVSFSDVPADESQAVDAILKLGGTIRRDEKLPSMPVIGVDLSLASVRDSDLKVLKKLIYLRGLTLNGANITDAGLSDLQDLLTLELVTLNRTKLQIKE